MMLNLRDVAARKARKHPLIAGKRVKARGVYCAVFDNGDSVFKLTSSQINHALLCDGVAAVRGPHFPKLINNFGEIEDGIYLSEVEKLTTVRGSGTSFGPTTRKISRNARAFCNGERALYALQEQFSQMGEHSLADAFEELLRFWGLMGGPYNLALDLHGGNMMVRPSTGELIINDPFVEI